MLLAVQEARAVGPRHSLEVNIEVEKPQAFDRTTEKISGFLTVCKLFIGIRMREDAVEEQIQWILSYVQRGSVNVWKQNILEDLESENLEYEIAEEFLADLRKEFRVEDKEAVKVAKLKKFWRSWNKKER